MWTPVTGECISWEKNSLIRKPAKKCLSQAPVSEKQINSAEMQK